MIQKEDIRIRQVIVHIMDATVGMPVLSDTMIDFGSEFAEFVRGHIYKTISTDDAKECEFYKEHSEIYQLLSTYKKEDFVGISKDIAMYLYEIMNSNVEIPSADLCVVEFKAREEMYLGILKLNYKESYTHRTKSSEDGTSNELIVHKSILPNETQKLSEAAVIRLEDYSIKLLEKKYSVNGEKTNYFSYLFLKCSAKLSNKTKLSIVARAVETVQKEHYEEHKQYEEHMKAKNVIHEELLENGSFVVEELASKIFEEEESLQVAFQDQMEKYDMVKAEIAPIYETTTKKFEKQQLVTDTGIEIKIPMEQYKDDKCVEFLTNDDGTTSVLIKNINLLTAKL
ncbi:MAG: nucleoid-associated protein [Eubacteriales bacterium]